MLLAALRSAARLIDELGEGGDYACCKGISFDSGGMSPSARHGANEKRYGRGACWGGRRADGPKVKSGAVLIAAAENAISEEDAATGAN